MKNFAFVLMFLSAIHCFLCQKYEDFNEWEESDQIRMRAKASRRFVHSKEELELTKAVPIINGKPCNDMHPLSVFIHSAGRSQGKYFDRRQTLRNTWVSEMKKLNVSVYFAIALNIKQSINDELKEESDRYEDIIQFPFMDAYYNLTLKAISILRWINKNCLTSTHILKTDDDVVVNSPQLLKKLSEFKPGFSGHLLSDAEVQRNITEKWFVPKEYYPNETWPDYLHGLSYIMAPNITHRLLDTIDGYSGYVLDIDDVFITGFVSVLAGIHIYHSKEISWSGCYRVCPLFKSCVVGQCGDKQDIENFWYEWNNTTNEFCETLVTTKTILTVISWIVIIGLMTTGIALISYILYEMHFK